MQVCIIRVQHLIALKIKQPHNFSTTLRCRENSPLSYMEWIHEKESSDLPQSFLPLRVHGGGYIMSVRTSKLNCFKGERYSGDSCKGKIMALWRSAWHLFFYLIQRLKMVSLQMQPSHPDWIIDKDKIRHGCELWK